MRKSYVLGAIFAVAGLASVHSAYATNFVNGTVWEVSQSAAEDAIPANLPTSGPNATFTAPSEPLNFASGGAYTIGEFLASGGATGITYNDGAAATDTLNGTLFDFKGTVSVHTGEMFTAGHDDGLTLIIGGVTVISAPGPTSYNVTTSTYTGPSGNQSFELVYGECCGAPADLNVNLPLSSATPEPATWALMVLGFGGLGAALRVNRKASAKTIAA
jgi:hypothetical protein